jgi:hypothetical protein
MEIIRDPSKYLGIAPAKVDRVVIDEDTHTATVIVPDDQLSLAIGKEGQNASNLVDYEDEFNHREDYISRYRHARAFHPLHPFWLLYNAQWALDNYTVICAGAQNPEAARSVGMVPAKNFDSAWAKATEILGEREPLALVLPNRTKRGGVIFTPRDEASLGDSDRCGVSCAHAVVRQSSSSDSVSLSRPRARSSRSP